MRAALGKIAAPFLAAALATLMTGCASDYVARTRDVRRAYESYDYPRALKLLEEESKSETDELLYLLDKGMLLHASRDYRESNKVLARAEKVAASLDFTSVSEEAKVLLSNERNKVYRGEDFEILLINVLKALNYSCLGEDEAAMVEVRRVDERLRKMRLEEKKQYEQLAIARYLGGVLYEDGREFDSALIDYRAAIELQGSVAPEVLARVAKQAGQLDYLEKLQETNPRLDATPLQQGEGEVVVVVELGKAPEKIETQQERESIQLAAVPHYVPRSRYLGLVSVSSEGSQSTAQALTSVDYVARRYLEERLTAIALKSAAGTAVKGAAAATVGHLTGSKELGYLTFLVLAAANAADLRSWLSLPAEFRIARLRLPAGRHTLTVRSSSRTEKVEVYVPDRRIAMVVVRHY